MAGASSVIIGSKHQGRVDAELSAKAPLRKIAERYGFSLSAVQRYKDNHWSLSVKQGGPGKRWEKTPPPDVAGKTPREKAEAHAAWLHSEITKAVAAGAATKDLSALSGQYNIALRTVAQLSGALQVTMSQIVKHPDFIRCQALLLEVLGDDVARVKKWEAGLAAMMGDDIVDR